MITKPELQQLIRTKLKDVDLTKPDASTQILQAMLGIMGTKYQELDDECKAMADTILNNMETQLTETVSKMPPSSQRKKMERGLASLSNPSLNAEHTIKSLSQPLPDQPKFLKDADTLFKKHLQSVLDLTSDVTKKNYTGPAGVARITLLFGCINELLAAHYLSQHYLVNQANSHIRTILEFSDKIKLFTVDPASVKHWLNTEEDREAQKEMQPGEVRKKLGKPKFDPIYSFFCARGPHGTFEAIKSFTSIQKNKENPKNITLTCWIGPTPNLLKSLTVSIMLLWSVMVVLNTIVENFGDALENDEVYDVFTASTKELKSYLDEHLFADADIERQEVKEFMSIFDKALQEMDELKRQKDGGSDLKK
ncbi:MAG: hypothetical protein ACKVQC_05840 [Elusimicrobiota bacterium]